MKKYIFRLMTTAFLGILVLPQAGQAYFTKSQSATVIDGGAVYTVTYDFGSPNYDLFLPIYAARVTSSEEGQSGFVSYTFLGKDEQESSGGVAKGIVLSDAEIRNGQYFIPKDSARRMTLVVVLSTTTATGAKDILPRQLAMRVEDLPFVMVKGGEETPGHLNSSELKYYTTPYAKIYPKP